jgi:hypothetical protein
MIRLEGAVRMDADCPTMVTSYDHLLAAPKLDVSGAAPDFQCAYYTNRDYVATKAQIGSLANMVTQCRELLATDQTIGDIDRTFSYRVFQEIILYNTLMPAIHSIGGK